MRPPFAFTDTYAFNPGEPTAPAAPHADFSRPPVSAPASPPTTPTPSVPVAPQAVAVPYEHFQRLLDNERVLAETRLQAAERERVARQEAADALVAKGKAEEAVKAIRADADSASATLRTQIATMESRTRAFAVNSELSAALSGLPLVSPAAAAQLREILRPQLDAHPEGDSFAVRTATYQSAAQLVAAARSNPDYAHFFAANTTGGAGAHGGSAAAPTPPPGTGADGPIDLKALGEAFVRAGGAAGSFGLRAVSR